MTELGVRYVTVMPRIASGFASEINAAVGKGAAGAGVAAGKRISADVGKGVEQSASKVGMAFKSVVTGALVLGGVRAISSFVRSAVDDFADLEDATGAASVVFGDSMDKIIKQSETAAKTMYMSKAQVIDAANTYGTLGKSAGLAGDDLAKFSTDMTQLAADLSSFKGGRPEDAVLAIGAALRGESEPIRRYGVQLNDAMLKARALKMGLIETEREALTPANRTLAAQAEILAQTTDAQGDAIRTAGTASNTQKELAATSADLSAEIGEKLAPAIVSAQKAGIGLIEWTMQNQELLIPLAKAFGIAAAAIGGFVAVSKGIEALKSARETIKGIGDAFTALGTKAKIATASAGAVGIALTAAAVIYGVFAQRNAEAEARVQDFTAALEADTGALGENTRAAVVNALEKQGLLEQGRAMGIAEKDLTDAVMGSAEAMERVASAARAAEKDYGGSRQQQALATQATEGFIGAIQGQNDELNNAIEAHKRVTSAMDSSTGETESNTSAITDGKLAYEDYTKAINGSYNAQLKLAGSERAAEAAIDEGAERIKEWTAELTSKYEAEIKADAAAKGRKITDEEAGKQAEKRAKKEVDAAIKSGKALDITTDAGRTNQEVLYGIAEAAEASISKMTDLERANGTAAARADTSRDAFIELAKSFGKSQEEAEELADQMGLLKSKDIDFTVRVSWKGQLSKQISVDGTGAGKIALKAGGGQIAGPGTGTSDEVPILASNGEWIIKEKSARYYGPALMSAINQGRIPREAFAGKYAAGGPVMPSYKGHSLDWWDDYLLTDLEMTRLKIRIKDLKADLRERETYYTGKGKSRKKRSRQKLRGLERTEATLELADAAEQLRLAKDAAKANSSASGTIADRVARYESQLEISEAAAATWRSAAESLTKSGGISLGKVYTSHTNAMGDRWQTSRETTAADLAARVGEQATQVETFISLLDQLRRAGASEALVSDVMALGTIEGTKAARLYLSDRSSMAIAEQGYARLAASNARLTAIGDLVGAAAIHVTVNEAATPEATKQAVVAGILAGRS